MYQSKHLTDHPRWPNFCWTTKSALKVVQLTTIIISIKFRLHCNKKYPQIGKMINCYHPSLLWRYLNDTNRVAWLWPLPNVSFNVQKLVFYSPILHVSSYISRVHISHSLLIYYISFLTSKLFCSDKVSPGYRDNQETKYLPVYWYIYLASWKSLGRG